MGISRIGHIAFVVSDMDKAEEFYTGILGFQKAFELKDNSGNPWINYFKLGDGQFVELFYRGAEVDAGKEPSVGYSHCCFLVDDINEIADSVVSRGGELDRPIKVGADGNHQCWVRDPDGNRIEFMQIVPGSPHAEHGG
jgi:catechol 2,3-dioxygenase-like lactoylglutathione lyase family enzyme